jgi:hypothetical protein
LVRKVLLLTACGVLAAGPVAWAQELPSDPGATHPDTAPKLGDPAQPSGEPPPPEPAAAGEIAPAAPAAARPATTQVPEPPRPGEPAPTEPGKTPPERPVPPKLGEPAPPPKVEGEPKTSQAKPSLVESAGAAAGGILASAAGTAAGGPLGGAAAGFVGNKVGAGLVRGLKKLFGGGKKEAPADQAAAPGAEPPK